jgi:preprotein translocase subunit SecE
VARRKEDDEFEEGRGDDDAQTPPEPEPPPGRTGSADTSAAAPAPRAARFGEGSEGRAARRERGVKGARAGFFERLAQFWHDIRAELRRVTWPTLKQVQSTTIITIIAVAFFATYLYIIDYGFTKLIGGLTKLFCG